MEDVRWIERPALRRPVVVAAFEGWNDAGEAASGAVRYLADRWGARPLATVDPDEFYDFTVVRPQVRLDEGMVRHIDWRTTELSTAAMEETGRDVVLIQGIEPNLRWRRFVRAISEVVTAVDAELVITLGALLAEVAHTRPVPITGTAADPALIARMGLQRSRYEGPTGIIGVLHDHLASVGVPSLSLWAAVPHYVRDTASPKATLALIRRAAEVLDLAIPTTDLDIAASAYERQVTDVVAGDTDVEAYVHHLEVAGEDDEFADDDDERPRLEFKSAEELAAEAERFLRDQGN